MELTRDELGGWFDTVQALRSKPWCEELFQRVDAAYAAGNLPVYPPRPDLFTALRLTPPERVKCVIVGQDPYHQPGQAHGLAFSIQPGTKLPPSLRNIGKELESDLGVSLPAGGTLTRWAEEGVLLLNNVLTVYDSAANSHKKWGWETFTTRLLQRLETEARPIAFVLWGRDAQTKGALVDPEHSAYPRLVLRAAHPSPLSARRGFLGSRPFSQANAFLEAHGSTGICWGEKKSEKLKNTP